jgi:hypothetical protein
LKNARFGRTEAQHGVIKEPAPQVSCKNTGCREQLAGLPDISYETIYRYIYRDRLAKWGLAPASKLSKAVSQARALLSSR